MLVMPQGKMTVPDDEIVRAMVERGDPAYTTSEIADMVGMTSEGVRNRLSDLESEGRIKSKKPSSRTVLWWPAENHDVDAFSA